MKFLVLEQVLILASSLLFSPVAADSDFGELSNRIFLDNEGCTTIAVGPKAGVEVNHI
jgi:hypothetical protein